MPKKKNWKTRALEIRTLAIAQAEDMKTSEDPRAAGLALVNVGRAQAMEDLLAEYGIDAEEEDKPKIILAS